MQLASAGESSLHLVHTSSGDGRARPAGGGIVYGIVCGSGEQLHRLCSGKCTRRFRFLVGDPPVLKFAIAVNVEILMPNEFPPRLLRGLGVEDER